jgi:hypothetical protein
VGATRTEAGDSGRRARRSAAPPHLARACPLLATIALCATLASCAASNGAADRQRSARVELERYLAQVEPIRLGVNRLLEGADPILGALREHRISRAVAARRMQELERRFAGFTVDIAAVTPQTGMLAGLHSGYAQTYVLEDAYLSALVSGLASGELTGLPNTQAEQRAAIIRWRSGLGVLARKAQLALPADLQQAGRGEIAPSPQGGS